MLRELGIGFSSSFFGQDGTEPSELPDEGFMGSTNLGDQSQVASVLPTSSFGRLSGCSQTFLQSPRQHDGLERGRVSNIVALTRPDEDIAGLPASVPGMFVRKNEVAANYLGKAAVSCRRLSSSNPCLAGFSSVGTTLATCLKDALEFQKLPLTASSLRFLIEAGPHVDEVGLSSTADLLSFELPPEGMAMQAIEGIDVHVVG